VGYVKGRKQPDRFVVFTAHYDHLGMMGKDTYFPGANDNGSGTAMLLDLARHYSEKRNRPDYSMAFMAFSGEEAGLFGSKYYVENPLFDMRAILLLVNLDMVGTGSEGITIVNGKAYKSLYDQMVEINDKKKYLSQIKDRGEACNSDHCPFYNTGIKSIFIYTMGEEHLEYHNVNDSGDRLPFTAYEGLFRLLRDYVQYVD
jgi:Zn-dependent M28 family amino/carboxypeptidase